MTEPVKISLRVVPGASKNEISVLDGAWKIRLTAPAVEGKANRALVEFLAKKLGINRGCIELAAGATSRNKSIIISGLSLEEINKRLIK